MKKFLIILFFLANNLYATIYYWVGGAGVWNGSSTTHWAHSSGGVGGTGFPTSTDDVIVDVNSGSGIISINTGNACNSADFTGSVMVPKLFNTWFVDNTLTLDPATVVRINGAFQFIQFDLINSINGKIDAHGDSIYAGLEINSVDGLGHLQLQSNLLLARTALISLTWGTLDANDQNLTAGSFNCFGVNADTVLMGKGIWKLLDDDLSSYNGMVWVVDNYVNVEVQGGQSTITYASESGIPMTFYSQRAAYHNIEFTGNNTGVQSYIFGENRFNHFSIIKIPASLEFENGSTTTVDSVSINGDLSGQNILATSLGGSWTITKPSGTVCADWIRLSDSQATGGATWHAGVNSTDVGGNSGWTFDACPPPPTGVKRSFVIIIN